MSKEMVISATPHETRVAIMEDGQLCEIYVEREKEFALVGSIYKGRVTRVLPGMQSAFVEIGLDGDAFLYVSDFLEGLEEYDNVIPTVEEKVQRMEDQGGHVFAAETDQPAMVEPSEVTSSPVSPASQVPAPAERPAEPPRPASPVGTRPFERRDRDSRGYGRDRNRQGRPGPGGGRGGRSDGPHGRDLPPSKYASHRPFEPPATDSGSEGETQERIILPGESLAKYRDRPQPTPGPAASSPVAEESPRAATAPPTEPLPAAPPGPMEQPPAEQTPVPQSPVQQASAAPGRESSAPRWQFSGGLEPLPGESLAKFRKQEPQQRAPEAEPEAPGASASAQTHFSESQFAPVPTPAPSHAPVQDASEPIPEVTPSPIYEDREQEAHTKEPRAASQDHPAPVHGGGPPHPVETDLTAEEVNALAEQVAEAQLEEEERATEASADSDDEAEERGEEIGSGFVEEESHEAAPEENGAAELTEGGDQEPALAEDAGAEAAEIAAAAAAHETPGPETLAPSQAQPSNARVSSASRARMQHPMRRGGRRSEGHRPRTGHRLPPRRPQLISELLKQGQEIIVQIAKEPLGKKGARITSHIALPGRYLVYMPTLDHTGVSRKIGSAEDRARLRHLVTEAKGSSGGGFIVRTAAASASPEEIRTDVEFLMRLWNEIRARAEQRKGPTLLHRDLNLVERILRDYLHSDYTAIWVDSEEEYTKVVDFVSRFQPQMANRVKLYTKEAPIFEEFGIQQEIDKGLRPKVWLKSGGYIVINHTEALVAIDVNTGKYVGRGSTRLEDTIVRTNLEAVKEVVRQIRLRDLGGIIIIDFIDMEERRNREKVMAALEEALRADRAPSKVLRFNEFGLVAITRKRTKQALERTLCQPCPYCTGSGMVKSVPTLCYEIQSEARKMAGEIESGSITLRVHPEIAKALKTRESALIEELEQWTKKGTIIQADPTLHWEQYDIY